ncbi:MAG: ornithine cyclodeaminase family protein [Brevirhabdus sp.]
MSLEIIGPEAEAHLDWLALTQAIEDGHRAPKAEIGDTFLYRDPDTLLSRAAWIDGMGIAVKSATIFPGNAQVGKPVVGGGVNLYSDTDGALEAIVDFHLVTKWKTAGDSLLAARLLARPDCRRILVIGAGTVARSLVQAYGALFPDAAFTIWNRTTAKAQALAAELNAGVATDLEAAVGQADIVTCATMSSEPVLKGEWLKHGQHVDLIGAYRPDMREVDNTALTRARIFVDSRETTVDHIGELKTPIASGVITADDVLADYYEIAAGGFTRQCDDDITLFKNGGGAHLDLMTSRYILNAWRNR